MASAKKRTPRSPRKRTTWPKGDWREGLRQRLQRLVSDAGSNNKFAAVIGLNPRRVGQWLNAEVVPGAANLRTISSELDISIDWLFDGLDADGKPTREPQPRKQSRSTKALEDDLAAAVWQELRARGTSVPTAVRLEISRPKLLKKLVEIVEADLGLLSKAASDEEPRLDAIDALLKAEAVAAGNDRLALKAARDWLVRSGKDASELPTSIVSGKALGWARPTSEKEVSFTDAAAFSGRILGGPLEPAVK